MRSLILKFLSCFIFFSVLGCADQAVRPESKVSVPTTISVKPIVVVIDPGHGGNDFGAHGVTRNYEKEVTLNISRQVSQLFAGDGRFKVILTRNSDYELSLPTRTQFANDNRADVFISIHANATARKDAQGLETYYLDNTDDAGSLKLAEKENNVSGTDLSDLQFIVSDLIQNLKLDDSISLAHYLQNDLHKTVDKRYPDFKNLGVKKGPFFVLVGAHMPCVLVEVSFIDHHVEGVRLASPAYQKLVAEGLYQGILSYFKNQNRI
jgi:N-acetylmuramoyl-L-alanine amidase